MVMDKKKKIISIAVMVIGLITLVVGVVLLVLHLTAGPTLADGEYLVSANEWIMNSGKCPETEEPSGCDEASVKWKFTEIGKGTLTTNSHINDYDFKWAIEDGRLLIRTNWLYELDNDYDYELDRGEGVLKLKSGEDIYEFVGSFGGE